MTMSYEFLAVVAVILFVPYAYGFFKAMADDIRANMERRNKKPKPQWDGGIVLPVCDPHEEYVPRQHCAIHYSDCGRWVEYVPLPVLRVHATKEEMEAYVDEHVAPHFPDRKGDTNVN
jgi:hypothetical protein